MSKSFRKSADCRKSLFQISMSLNYHFVSIMGVLLFYFEVEFSFGKFFYFVQKVIVFYIKLLFKLTLENAAFSGTRVNLRVLSLY